MNEYDPFDENKYESDAPEAELPHMSSIEPEQSFANDGEGEARISAFGADAVPSDAGTEQGPAEHEPSAGELFRGQSDAPEQPAYQNSYYSYGGQNAEPVYTARPAVGGAEGRRTETGGQPHSVQAQTKKEKRRSGGFWKKAVALALVCALLGGAAGFGGSLLADRLHTPATAEGSKSSTNVQIAAPRESTELGVIQVEAGKLMSASQVYEKNVNSTVGITTEITTTNWWGYQSSQAAAGSGFILTEDGYILTNEHVIKNANTITVAMYDGSSYPATLVGYDASNDIAVLKIDAKGLTPVTLGDSDAMKVGDEVIAIGNPLGELTFSLTKGNVSALNRAVTLSSNVTMNLIQTDAAINSGNSGGPLFNMYGEVVGITNAKYSSSGYSGEASIDNIGFAIPINSIREIVSSIIEKGYIVRPYIGVSVANVSEESQSYGMPKGAAIRSVEEGGPAEQAGLQANDIVTAIDGEPIENWEALANKVAASQPGDQLNCEVYRKGETVNITITVGEKKQDAKPEQNTESQQGQQGQQGQNEQGQQGQQGQNEQGQQGQNDQGQSDPWGWGFGSFPWGFGFGG